MVDFYGESYGLNLVTPLTGLRADRKDLTLRLDGRSQVFPDGSSFLAATFATSSDWDALAAATDVRVSWVVVTGPASNGTISASAGLDPTFELTDPAAAAEPLGAQSVTGAQTLVFGPSSSITHAALVAGDAFAIARLEVTAGAVEVNQVKLRVWPATGPRGAWTRTPGYPSTAPIDKYVSDPEVKVASAQFTAFNKYDQARQDGITALVGWEGLDPPGPADLRFLHQSATQTGEDLTLVFEVFDVTNVAPFGAASFITANCCYLQPRLDPIASLAAGETGGIDPDEVDGELVARVRAIGGGPLLPTFDGWSADAGVTVGDAGTRVAIEPLEAMPDLMPTSTPSGVPAWLGPFHSFGRIGYGIPHASGAFVALTASRYLALGVGTPMLDGRAGGPFVEFASGTISGTALVVVPTHEIFDPAATPTAPTRPPRFYVTFTEVDEHPRDVSHVVGIGKPADDASIFRVPAPLGTMRELRHGEKVSDVSVAYPLKVKLEDGSWTVVAGMTPDD